MNRSEIWRTVVRRKWTGAIIFLACVAGGIALGLISPPLYEATTLFQVQALADLGTDPRAWDAYRPRLRLSADNLEKWLGQEEVLQRVVDLAGERGHVTAVRFHRQYNVFAAGDGGVYQAVVRDPSPERAQHLANALAVVLGNLAVDLVRQDQQILIDRIRAAMKEARDLERNSVENASLEPFESILGPRRSALVRHDAVLALYTQLETQVLALEVAQRTDRATATVLQRAGRPIEPVTPGWPLYAQFGIVSGVFLGLSGIFFKDAVHGPGA